MFRKDLQQHIQILPDGSERLTAISIDASPKNICVVNTYMPTQGHKSDVEYTKILDEIYEIKQKYGKSHTFIWAGDMNASMYRSNGPKQDDLFKRFCITNDFNHVFSSFPTFYSYTGDISQIDYILHSHDLVLESFFTHTGDYENTSTHVALSTTIRVILKVNACHNENPHKGDNSKKKRKINWEKIDLAKYSERVEEKMNAFNKVGGQSLPPEVALVRLGEILVEAAEELSAPQAKAPKKNTKYWPPDVIAAAKISKAAFWRWKEHGYQEKSVEFF